MAGVSAQLKSWFLASPVIITGSQILNILLYEEVGLQQLGNKRWLGAILVEQAKKIFHLATQK